MSTNQAVSVATQGAAVAIPASVQALEAAKEQAQLLAKSDLIPQAYMGKPANCLIAFNMAQRLDADPLMVMQNLYIVHGSPGWSSKFLIATFNQSPEYTALRYDFKGDEDTDDWACRARAVEKATGETLTGPWVSIKIAKAEGWYQKKGSKWQTMPELMLRYRAATLFIRTTAPEISMGLQTAEELHDVLDAAPNQEGVYETKPANQSEALDSFAKDAAAAANDEEDATVIDPKTGEVEQADVALETANKVTQDQWASWMGEEPISGQEAVYDDVEQQHKFVEAAVSLPALGRIFATQEPAIRKLSDEEQLKLLHAYNARRKEFNKK
jgi:hypothetical protein